MGVSKNNWYPQIIHLEIWFSMIFTTILGVFPYFGSTPMYCIEIQASCETTPINSSPPPAAKSAPQLPLGRQNLTPFSLKEGLENNGKTQGEFLDEIFGEDEFLGG